MPIILVPTKQVLSDSQWRASGELIVQALVEHGSARKEDIRMCPGLGQLKRAGEVTVEVGWFANIRTDSQKAAVKNALQEGLAETLNYATSDIKVNIVEGEQAGWVLRDSSSADQAKTNALLTEVPMVIVATRQIPDVIKQHSVADSIIQALVTQGGAKKEDVEVCPGYGQLREDTDASVEISIGWYSGRTADQKVVIKKRIVDSVSVILNVKAFDMNVSLFEARADRWAVRGELIAKKEHAISSTSSS